MPDDAEKRWTSLILRLLIELVFAVLVIAVLTWLLVGELRTNDKLTATTDAAHKAATRAESVAKCVNDILAVRSEPAAIVNAANLAYRPTDDAVTVAEQHFLAHLNDPRAYSELEDALARKSRASQRLTAALLAQDANNRRHPLGLC
jgi:hypothetical protein